MPKTEKKIFLDRTDNLTTVVDKLIKTSAEKIVLNIPRNSLLGDALQNFQVLKRESATAGKELMIESVDDHILELANLCGLKAVNPVFKTRERSVSDIVPRGVKVRKTEDIKQTVEKEMEPEIEPKPSTIFKKDSIEPKGLIKKEAILSPKKEKKAGPVKVRKFVWLLGLLIFLFLVYEAVANILPRATITIALKKNSVDFNALVQVATSVKQADWSVPNVISLPGELLTADRNLTLSFPASGKAVVQTSATGTLWIYNGYSSAPQTLVKSTRLESPDGKIFRLVNQVIVPGAKIVNGQIQASKILAAVAADKPGPDYNIPPANSWKIPGFQGTPRYQGFYADSLLPMTGGFSGEKAVPSPSDLLSATTSIEKSLADLLNSQLSVITAPQFKLFDNAKSFQIKTENVLGGDVNSGVFKIYIDGEMQEFIFDEGMLKQALVNQAMTGLTTGLKAFPFEPSYSTSTVDFGGGKMTFNTKGTTVLVAEFDPVQFKTSIAGKDETTLRSIVFGLPGLEKATISLWPFWVRTVPSNQGKIQVIVN